MANLIGAITKEKVPLHGEFEIVEYTIDNIELHPTAVNNIYYASGRDSSQPIEREGYKLLGVVGIIRTDMNPVIYNAETKVINGHTYISYSYYYVGRVNVTSSSVRFKVLYVKE